MSDIDIIKYKNFNHDVWESFILKTNNATFFSTVDYLNAFEKNVYILLIKERGQIQAGLPFVIQSLVPLIGHFFQICRVETEVLIVDGITKELEIELKLNAYNELNKFLLGMNVANLYITTKIRSNDSSIYKQLGYSVYNCGTFMLNIEPELDVIIRNFSKGHKSSIQKAIKAGVEVRILENAEAINQISDFIETQKKLFVRRHDTMSVVYYKSENFLKTLFNSKYHKVLFVVAKFNEKVAATGIFVCMNKSLFYYAGNSDYELVRECQASNLLQLEVIKYAKENGYTSYDLGGADVVLDKQSELYGVTLFKKGFGGELLIYDYAKCTISPTRSAILIFISKMQNNRILGFIYKLFKNAE